MSAQPLLCSQETTSPDSSYESSSSPHRAHDNVTRTSTARSEPLHLPSSSSVAVDKAKLGPVNRRNSMSIISEVILVTIGAYSLTLTFLLNIIIVYRYNINTIYVILRVILD